MMVLDECTPFPCPEDYARASNELTLEWAERAKEQAAKTAVRYGHEQGLFGIVQGSVYPRIRERSARRLVELDFDGYAIGGLAVGEPEEDLYRMLDVSVSCLPEDRPRYLMGVGTPRNLLEAVARGVDMFDCVLPTRNGRNAAVFTSEGTLNLRNAAFRSDFTPVDARCDCYTCSTFTRAYLRHLFAAREILALQLATIHNLSFYIRLMRSARRAIQQGTFPDWMGEILRRLETPDSGGNSADSIH
jgi:queuine tRNA-ribosyltransferase